ncbi:uncharacterized protein [Clytia hemisphaerica]|uniref:Uncharacterized protein n=1 Tax=Clytia hemisphaerica TaxID=252671 RepID=A0A7M5V6Z0_9CNID
MKDCTSYDTCRNDRVGKLCSSCPSGYSFTIFNEYSCVANEKCNASIIWFVLSDSLIVLLMLMFSEKVFYVFAHLGRKKERNVRNLTQKQWRKEHNDNAKVLGQRHERKEIEGKRKGEQRFDGHNAHGEQSSKLVSGEKPNYGGCNSTSASSNTEYNHDNSFDCHQNTNELRPLVAENNLNQNNIIGNPMPLSTQGMMKIIFNFYQILGLILIQNPLSLKKLIPTEILVSIFSIKLQIPSLEWNTCPLEMKSMTELEIFRIIVWFTPFASLSVGVFGIGLYEYITTRRLQNDQPRREIVYIDENTKAFNKIPLPVRIKCAYIQLLCFGHTAITVLSFQLIHPVTINGSSYHFMDASKAFSTDSVIVSSSLFVLFFWCIPFIPALYKATRWLRQCRITPNQFLLILTFPLSALVFLLKQHKTPEAQNRSTEMNGQIAKHILHTLFQPYRLRESRDQRKEQAVCWECMYLFSRTVLAFVCTFSVRPENRLWLISSCLLLHYGIHQTSQIFNLTRLNMVESICLQALILINCISILMETSTKDQVIGNNANYVVLLSFAPFISYLMFPLLDIVYGKVGKYLTRRYDGLN